MMIDLIPKELIVISHLFGVAVGAGGAYVSDALFFASIKDRKLESVELRLMKVASLLVWTGLGLLLLSGTLLALTDPAKYLVSTKFQAKMTIIVILTINGIIFHLHHIPFLDGILNKHLSIISKTRFRRSSLLVSGVISFTSWTSALILGSLPTLPLSYITIMAIYTSIITFGAISVVTVRHLVLPNQTSWLSRFKKKQ
jgi:hypothetical protein